jgi:hypothetical protein
MEDINKTEEVEEVAEEIKDEKSIIKTLFTERDNYQKANETQRGEFNDIYNVYIGKMDNVKKVPYKTKESSSKLRTEIAYVVPSIFSGTPQVEIEGVGEEDKTISKILEKIVNYRFETIPQFYEKVEGWVKQSVTFGTSILKVNWKFETEDKEEQDEMGQMVQYKVPVKDEPELDVPNILDCYYNPILSDVYCQSSMIFRSVLPVEEVTNNPAYDFQGVDGELNRTKIKEKGSQTADIYNSSQQEKSDLIDSQKAGKGTVEIYERITRDRIQTVCDGAEQLVLRDTQWDYGYINAVKLTHEPSCIPNRFEGWGVGQNTMGVGKLLYQLDNQIIEGVKMSNNPMFLAKKGKGIDARQAVSKPGGIVFVDDDGEPIGNSIIPLQFNDTKQGALELRNRLDDDHKRASGANDLVQGSASNDTLGQDQIASTYSSQRFELIQRRFKQALSDVAEMIIKMELKNLQSPDSAILRIFPEEVRVDVYQLLINEAQDVKYNVSIKGETNIAKNKDIQIKQLIETYNLFGAILPPENQMEWARKILELRGVDDLDKLVPDAQQFAQIQQQQAMQAMNPSLGVGQPQA